MMTLLVQKLFWRNIYFVTGTHVLFNPKGPFCPILEQGMNTKRDIYLNRFIDST
jgi:hypothetical protein